jgi:hypothetical protein
MQRTLSEQGQSVVAFGSPRAGGKPQRTGEVSNLLIRTGHTGSDGGRVSPHGSPCSRTVLPISAGRVTGDEADPANGDEIPGRCRGIAVPRIERGELAVCSASRQELDSLPFRPTGDSLRMLCVLHN